MLSITWWHLPKWACSVQQVCCFDFNGVALKGLHWRFFSDEFNPPHAELGNDFHLTWVFIVEPEGIWAILCHGTWCWGHWGFGHVQVLWHQLSLHGAWADKRLLRQPQLHTIPREGEEGSVNHWQGVCHPDCHWWVSLTIFVNIYVGFDLCCKALRLLHVQTVQWLHLATLIDCHFCNLNVHNNVTIPTLPRLDLLQSDDYSFFYCFINNAEAWSATVSAMTTVFLLLWFACKVQ